MAILPIQKITDADGKAHYRPLGFASKYKKKVYNDKLDYDIHDLKRYRDSTDSNERERIKNKLMASSLGAIDFDEMDAGLIRANAQIIRYRENMEAAGKANFGFAAGIKNIAKSVASMGIEALISIGIAKIFELGYNWFDKAINASKYAIEEADKLQESWSKISEEQKAAEDLIDDYGKRYEELRKGVGQHGENKLLNTEEYEEYLAISNKLAATFPDMIAGWDAQGNAILKTETNVRSLTEAYLDMERANRLKQSSEFEESGYKGEIARVYSGDKGSYTKYQEFVEGMETFEEWKKRLSERGSALEFSDVGMMYSSDVDTESFIHTFNTEFATELGQQRVNAFETALEELKALEIEIFEGEKVLPETLQQAKDNLTNAIELLYGGYVSASDLLSRQATYDLNGLKKEYVRIAANAFDKEAAPIYGGNKLGDWDTTDTVKNFFGQIPMTFDHDSFGMGEKSYTEYMTWFTENILNPFAGSKGEKARDRLEAILELQTKFASGVEGITYGNLKELIDNVENIELFGDPLWNAINELVLSAYEEIAQRALEMGLSEEEVGQLTSKDMDYLSAHSGEKKISGLNEVRQGAEALSASIEELTESYNKFMSDQEKALTNLNALSEQGYLTPEQMKEIDQTGYSRAVVTTPYGTQHTDYQITRQIELAKAQEEINRLTEEGNKKQAEAKEAYEEFLKLAKEGKKEQAEAQKVALDGYVNEINQINLMADAIRGSTSALNAFKRACQMGELGDGFRSAKEAIDAIIEGLENGKVGTNKFRAAIELIGGSDMLSKFQNGLISNQTLKDFAKNAGKFYNDEGDIDRRKVFDMMAKSGVGSYYMQDGKQRFRVNRDATMEEYQKAFGGVSVEFASLILDAINENAKNDSEIIGPEDYRRRRKENEEALQKVKNMSVSANSVVINGNVEGGSDGSGGNGSNGNGSNGNGEVPDGKKTEPPAQEPPPTPEPKVVITEDGRELADNAHAPFPDIDDLSEKFEALTPTLNASLDSTAAFLQAQRTAQAQRNELQNIYEEAGYSDSVDAEYLNALLDLMNQYDDSIFKTHDKSSERKNIPSGSKAEEESTAEGVEPEKEATVTEAAEEAAAETAETFSQAYAKRMNYEQTGFASGDIPTPHNQGASNQPPQNDEPAESPDTSTETVSPEIERLNKNLEGLYTAYNNVVQGYNDGNAYLDKNSTLDALQFLAKNVSASLDSYRELPNVGPEDQNIISYENLLNDINNLINALSGAGAADLPFGGWMTAYNMPYTDVRGRGRGGAKDVPGTSGEADTESLSDETVEVEVVANTEEAEEQISALSESSEEPVEIPVTTELEEASSKNAELVEAVKEKTTKPVDADTAEADAAVNSLNAEIERTATKSTDASQIRAAIRYANELNALLAKEIVKPFSMADGGGGNSGGGSGVDGGVAKVDGGMSLAGGNTLVGEIAPEIIVDRKTGTWRLVDYPQLTHLNPGDIVFNGKQTEAILKGRKTHFSKAMVDGNAKGGKSFAGYIGKARKPDSIYTSIDRKIVQQREGFVVFDDPDGNGVVIPQTWDISQDVGDGKGKKNGKGGGGRGGGGSGEKEEREWIDWIERLLELAKKATEKAIEDVADKIGYIAKNAQLDLALTKNRAELQKNEAAYNRYIEQADLMRKRNGLSADIVNKIQTGAIDITEYGQEMANKIKEYQEWYEKAEKCKDTIDELNKQEKELQRQKLDNIVDVFENKIARLESSISLNSTKLEKKAAYGEEIVAQDYIDAIAATEKKIAQLQEERTAYAKQFNALVKSGVLEPNSDAWHEYISNLEEIDETIVQTHTDLAGLKDEMSNIPLTNLQYALERLKALQSDIEAFRSFHDAQGTKNEPGSLIELIENGHEQIQNLKDQNEMLKSQQGGLDVLSEKWQELQGQIESNEQAIWDIKSAQEEWNDAITDLQIDRLQEEREELEKTNEELEKRKEMEDAIEEYEKAKQRTKLVYQAGKGFQYVADQDAIKEAKDRLDELRHQEMLDKIDEAIEALEDQKETDNIYDYQGIDVLKAFTGNEGSELYDLVHATTDFDKLLSDKMATVLGSNNARGTEALSVQIGDITVQGVQNVDDFAQSIVDELPNRLIQKLYS